MEELDNLANEYWKLSHDFGKMFFVLLFVSIFLLASDIYFFLDEFLAGKHFFFFFLLIYSAIYLLLAMAHRDSEIIKKHDSSLSFPFWFSGSLLVEVRAKELKKLLKNKGVSAEQVIKASLLQNSIEKDFPHEKAGLGLDFLFHESAKPRLITLFASFLALLSVIIIKASNPESLGVAVGQTINYLDNHLGFVTVSVTVFIIIIVSAIHTSLQYRMFINSSFKSLFPSSEYKKSFLIHACLRRCSIKNHLL